MIEPVAVVFVALLIDFVFGDPRNRFHPTAWIGALIARLAPAARGHSCTTERLAGVCIVAVPALVVIFLLVLLDVSLGMLTGYLYTVIAIVLLAVLLKATLAVRGMERHAMAVVAALEAGNLRYAREYLSMIVKRDTDSLDEDHIYSAVVESVSENTVDGITGPLFYFGFFGIFGSFVYRVVNTADSMVGYKNQLFKDIGWFAATCDKTLNYAPSRLTALVMVLSSVLLGNNWKESYRVMVRDGKNTESPNAGYPMAAIAGALGTKLEKIDHYSIGNGTVRFSKRHVISAISLMKATSVIFGMLITIPTILLMSYVGWWIHA